MTEQTVSMYDESTTTAAPSSFIVETSGRLILGILVVGGVVGALVMGLQLLLRQLFVEPVLCGSMDAFSLCANGGSIALNTATVIAAVIGTIALVRLSIYRPLLISIAAAISLWGANAWLGALTWYEMTAWLIFLYAVAYGVFAWVLRIYNFPVAFVLVVALVIAARIVLRF